MVKSCLRDHRPAFLGLPHPLQTPTSQDCVDVAAVDAHALALTWVVVVEL